MVIALLVSINMKTNQNKRRTPAKNGKNKNAQALVNTTFYSSLTNGRFGFMPPRKLVELRYRDYVAMGSIVTGAATVYVFRLNSIFDPDRTGTGHQPYGHDTLALMYNRYRVNAVKYKVTFGGLADACLFACVPTNGSLQAIATLADFDLATELPYAVSGLTGAQGTPNVVFERLIDLNELNGSKKVEYSTDDRFAAIFGSNPTEVIDFNVLAYNPSATTFTIRGHVELQFYCEVYDPILQAIS